MKKILFLLSLLTLSSTAFATFLDDKTAMREMIGAGIQAKTIFAAKNEQTKATISALALEAAPCYPLDQILALYPGGENAFYQECAKKPFLYEKFFLGLAGEIFHDHNPLEYEPTIRGAHSCVTDCTRATFTGVNYRSNRLENVPYVYLPTFFRSFQDNPEVLVNVETLKKLLETELPKLTGDLRRKSLKNYEKLRLIQEVAPFVRAEIALSHDFDLALAYSYFLKAAETAPCDTRREFVNIHLAEIELGVYTHLYDTAGSLLSSSKGLTHLHRAADNPIAKLRLAQFYLGFFGHVINKREGFKYLKKLFKNPQVSHLAYRYAAEYYLGITNPEAYHIDQAKKYLNQAFEACEGIPNLEDAIALRRAEIALGIYDQNADQPLNIPYATEVLERISPDADLLLHRIYTGYYDPAYKDDTKADALWNKLLQKNDDYTRMKHAIQLYRAGRVDKAVQIFEDYPGNPFALYYLARIKSNPKHTKHYNQNAAFGYYGAIIAQGVDFRDTYARFIKLFMGKNGLKIKPGFVAKAANYLVKKILKGYKAFPLKELEKAGFDCSDIIDSYKDEAIDDEGAATTTTTTTTSSTTANADADDDDESSSEAEPMIVDEEATYFEEALDAIQDTDNVRTLSDRHLQSLYDELGSKIRWKKLLKLVKGFGGIVDLKAQTMKLPHCKVFNFHRPHEGNPMLSMKHYWAVLRRMLDKEYTLRCQAETESDEHASQEKPVSNTRNSQRTAISS